VNFIPYWESLHIHTHCKSLVDYWKIYVCKEIYAHWLLDSSLYVWAFLASYLTVFSGLDTCVCWFLVEDLTLFFSFFCLFVCFFVLVIVFLYTLFTFCPFVTKRGSIFCFWTGNVFSNWSSVFLSQNGQRGSLLVFYVGYILDDKNTLCNGCFLTGLSVLFGVFK
jgi:hypothetical protein